MSNVRFYGVPGNADELDLEYADPSAVGDKSVLGWKFLKTVQTAGLAVVDGALVVPLGLGEDEPGRAFRPIAVQNAGGQRLVSKPGPYDYHNREPETAGTIKQTFSVGDKVAGRIDLAPYLFDPDRRGVKVELIPEGDNFYQDEKPAWVTLEGNVLLVDTSAVRATTVIAVRLTDEKGASATLNVIVRVVGLTAPAAPTATVYVP
jgi:hypothetical protein